jgi:PrcB C-terminal
VVAAGFARAIYTRTGEEQAVGWRDISATLDAPRFSKRRVSVERNHEERVLIALGPRSSTGYDLRIVRVVERKRSILVIARERTPSLGEQIEPRLTYPFRLIEFRRSDKPVHVELEGRP